MNLTPEIEEYRKQLVAEKESLIEKYMEYTGFTIDEIVLVEKKTENGFKFYPEPKYKYDKCTKCGKAL